MPACHSDGRERDRDVQIGGTIGARRRRLGDGQGAPCTGDRGGLPGRRAVHPGAVAAGRAVARLALVVFSAGFCMSGAQTGLNAFAPGCYPTVARATGVSWMLGMGRFGSILGSAVGGALLGLGWGFSVILAMLAIPAVCAAIAILLTQLGSAGADGEGSCRTLAARALA